MKNGRENARIFPRYEGLDALRVFSSFGVVFLHVFVAAGYPNSLWLLVKFRDFALPLMVMSSFFLLTLLFARKRDNNFGSFFSRRLNRFWIPLIVWTFAYSLSEAFLFPALLGAETFAAMPAPIVYLTGYRHLWFLQFIFVGSLLMYWLLKRLTGESEARRTKFSVFCFAAAVLYAILFWAFLKNYTDWDNLRPESDMNLRIFVSQAGNYILYIPIAVGIGLAADKINDLFDRNAFRRLSLAAALVTMLVHLGTDGVLWTREIYGVAVFLAALQPWGKISSKLWRSLAAYSYGIYILHFLPVQILWLVVASQNSEPGGVAVFGFAVFIYLASFAAAVALRKLFPADWLLPLVPVSRERERQLPAEKFAFAAPAAQTPNSNLRI